MKVDMHVHSNNSWDSGNSLDGIVKHAKKAGIGGVAITDHDKITIKKVEIRKGIVLFPGCEVKTNLGDVLAYNIKEIPKTRDFFLLIEKLKEENCIVAIAHPFDLIRKEAVKNKDAILTMKKKIDFLEINARCLPFFVKKTFLFSKKHGFKNIAGSDAHLLNEIGKNFTVFDNQRWPKIEVEEISYKSSFFSILPLISTKLYKIKKMKDKS